RGEVAAVRIHVVRFHYRSGFSEKRYGFFRVVLPKIDLGEIELNIVVIRIEGEAAFIFAHSIVKAALRLKRRSKHGVTDIVIRALSRVFLQMLNGPLIVLI